MSYDDGFGLSNDELHDLLQCLTLCGFSAEETAAILEVDRAFPEAVLLEVLDISHIASLGSTPVEAVKRLLALQSGPSPNLRVRLTAWLERTEADPGP